MGGATVCYSEHGHELHSVVVGSNPHLYHQRVKFWSNFGRTLKIKTNKKETLINNARFISISQQRLWNIRLISLISLKCVILVDAWYKSGPLLQNLIYFLLELNRIVEIVNFMQRCLLKPYDKTNKCMFFLCVCVIMVQLWWKYLMFECYFFLCTSAHLFCSLSL